MFSKRSEEGDEIAIFYQTNPLEGVLLEMLATPHIE
jgi:hypothetical protein